MSESSLRHIHDEETKEYRGCLWKEWAPGINGWIWMAETSVGRCRDFTTEADAERWLRSLERRAA